jgi:hypothetical protein
LPIPDRVPTISIMKVPDPKTERAVRAFLDRAAASIRYERALLYGPLHTDGRSMCIENEPDPLRALSSFGRRFGPQEILLSPLQTVEKETLIRSAEQVARPHARSCSDHC